MALEENTVQTDGGNGGGSGRKERWIGEAGRRKREGKERKQMRPDDGGMAGGLMKVWPRRRETLYGIGLPAGI